MILIVHAPPIIVDPVRTAFAQVRNGYPVDSTSEEVSLSDTTKAVLKKMLKP